MSCMAITIIAGGGGCSAVADPPSRPSSTLCTRRHFRGHVLPQPGVVAQILRLHAADDPLSLADELIQLLAAANIQFTEPLEELGQVLHGRVRNIFGLPSSLPESRSVRWLTSLASSAVNASSANRTASSKRDCTRRHSSS